MKKTAILSMILALLLTCAALGEEWRADRHNRRNFGALLMRLLAAYETPSDGDAGAIDELVNAIAAQSASDGEVARAIAEHWRAVYLDPDYRLLLYDGGETASTLYAADIPDGPGHAFVVLGYELSNGRMTDELKGRCDAAAAAARAYPESLLVCSGGATGKNNPQKHTEAGVMKDYLVRVKGIDPNRVLTDERAMTTLENAVNTFAILRAQGVSTFTVVTSSYHQRWGQALYNAMSAICRQSYGQAARIVGNYSFDIEPSEERYRQDARIAVKQLASMLDLPDDALGKG